MWRVVCGVRGRGRARVWWVGGAVVVEEGVGGDVMVVVLVVAGGEDRRGRGIVGMVKRWMRSGC